MDAINTLKEPFPTEVLSLLDFGSADGRKDTYLEETFVYTNSIKQFLQDRHSIIVGQIGSGKSALFELLKVRSKKVGIYKGRLIIPIEEAVSFQLLRAFITDEFSGYDNRLIYKLIWKFQILNRVCEEIYKLPDFPKNKHEKEIREYLQKIKSKEFDESVIGKLKGLLSNSLVISTKVSESPITVEVGLKGSAGGDTSKKN